MIDVSPEPSKALESIEIMLVGRSMVCKELHPENAQSSIEVRLAWRIIFCKAVHP